MRSAFLASQPPVWARRFPERCPAAAILRPPIPGPTVQASAVAQGFHAECPAESLDGNGHPGIVPNSGTPSPGPKGPTPRPTMADFPLERDITAPREVEHST
jgi:hypothetical protein